MFKPKRVFFEPGALEYPLGKSLWDYFNRTKTTVQVLKSNNRVTGIPGKTPQEAYSEGKETLVVGVRKTLNFETCKPSAHYQLPLATSCMGKCEYCYLNTQLGKKPYVRIYVNLEEILAQARRYIEEREPETTYFEGAATSDPLPVEPYTGNLLKTINFFGQQERGYFRFVTKFGNVESLLEAEHNGHTTIRFSINAESIIKKYEHNTDTLEERIQASRKVIEAGYPLGFIIAPVFLYPQWEKEYSAMMTLLQKELGADQKIYFEVISHRFTTRAKNNILNVFPNTALPMQEETRKFKFGQFGYGKYVYPKEELENMKSFFAMVITHSFPRAVIDYMI